MRGYQKIYLRGPLNESHHGDHTAGANTVIESHPTLVVRIVALPQEVLVAHVVGSLIDHPVTAVNSDRVAAAEVGVQVRAFAAALIGAALEVSVLVEDYLETDQLRDFEVQIIVG